MTWGMPAPRARAAGNGWWMRSAPAARARRGSSIWVHHSSRSALPTLPRPPPAGAAAGGWRPRSARLRRSAASAAEPLEIDPGAAAGRPAAKVVSSNTRIGVTAPRGAGPAAGAAGGSPPAVRTATGSNPKSSSSAAASARVQVQMVAERLGVGLDTVPSSRSAPWLGVVSSSRPPGRAPAGPLTATRRVGHVLDHLAGPHQVEGAVAKGSSPSNGHELELELGVARRARVQRRLGDVGADARRRGARRAPPVKCPVAAAQVERALAAAGSASRKSRRSARSGGSGRPAGAPTAPRSTPSRRKYRDRTTSGHVRRDKWPPRR